MSETDALPFDDVLRLIDERSTAFRAAVAAAPDLDAQVPTCPEWSLFELAQHLGQGRRRWAGTIAAGPGGGAPNKADDPAAPRERDALLEWSAESTRLLLDVLREAGPDRGCWTWWGASQSPQTSGAAARRQLHEVAVHTYDAQLTIGAPQPLPQDVALDCVDEFLFTCGATTAAWPHEHAAADFHATEGRSWRQALGPDGARVTRDPTTAADATMLGTANELALVIYDRYPFDSVRIDGDRRLIDLIWAWNPE